VAHFVAFRRSDFAVQPEINLPFIDTVPSSSKQYGRTPERGSVGGQTGFFEDQGPVASAISGPGVQEQRNPVRDIESGGVIRGGHEGCGAVLPMQFVAGVGEDLVEVGRWPERVLCQVGDVGGGCERDEYAVGGLDAAGVLEVAFEDEHRFGGGQVQHSGVLGDGRAVMAVRFDG
jgi:hypothetical protein